MSSDGLLPCSRAVHGSTTGLGECEGHDDDDSERYKRHSQELVVEVDGGEGAGHAEHAHEVQVDEVHVGQELLGCVRQ